MKKSMKTAFKQYGTHRMVKNYIEDMYAPAIDIAGKRNKNNYALAQEIGEWRKHVPGRFSTVTIKEVQVDGIHGDVFKFGNKLTVTAKVDKGQLIDEELLAELIATTPDEEVVLASIPMKLKHSEGSTLNFFAEYSPQTSGPVRYGIRVIPVHPGLSSKYESRLVRWS